MFHYITVKAVSIVGKASVLQVLDRNHNNNTAIAVRRAIIMCFLRDYHRNTHKNTVMAANK